MSLPVFSLNGLDRVKANLAKAQAEIERRKVIAARSAANVFRKYIRAEARRHRSPKHATHQLERRVELVKRLDGFAVRDKAPYAHLVVKGHRIVGHRPNRIDTGQMARPVPFVHDAWLAARNEPLIAARVVMFEGGPEVPDS